MPAISAEWLLEEWAARFAAGYQAMAGHALVRESPPPAVPPADALVWRQPFDLDSGAFVEIGVSAAGWRLVGGRILAAAGIEQATDEDCQPAYLEALRQSLAGLASALSASFGRTVTATGPGSHPPDPLTPAAAVAWMAGETRFAMTLGASAALLALPEPAPTPQAEASATAPVKAPAAPPAAPNAPAALEVLYDVELPVSVSFGRAHLPIKEVMKLTSGSIVELNRGIAEPVEIIVNNCVIARGEVVVVDGNYGVRILEIVSRSERLRTLH